VPVRERQQRFDAIYTEHRRALHAYFLGRTGDPEQALDLLQELFLRVWRSLDSLESLPAEKRQFWLFSVGRNLVVDHHRARATRERVSAALDAPKQWSAQPEASAISHEQLGELEAAIVGLPEELRVVLVMAVLGERNSTEIGALLGRPPATVRYQLARARQRLAEQLRAGYSG
jgi:RNA polymerase sigma factor (sigma-70 family)